MRNKFLYALALAILLISLPFFGVLSIHSASQVQVNASGNPDNSNCGSTVNPTVGNANCCNKPTNPGKDKQGDDTDCPTVTPTVTVTTTTTISATPTITVSPTIIITVPTIIVPSITVPTITTSPSVTPTDTTTPTVTETEVPTDTVTPTDTTTPTATTTPTTTVTTTPTVTVTTTTTPTPTTTGKVLGASTSVSVPTEATGSASSNQLTFAKTSGFNLSIVFAGLALVITGIAGIVVANYKKAKNG